MIERVDSREIARRAIVLYEAKWRVDLERDHLNEFAIPGTINRAGVLGDFNLLGPAKLIQFDRVQRDVQVFGDQGAAGDGGHVAQHRLAAIAEARGLDCTNLQYATQLVLKRTFSA